MSRTFIRQATQIRQSDSFDDTLAAGSTLQSGSASVEGDLNALRSQTKRVLGTANWYTALSGRSLSGLETDLADIEGKKLLRRVQVLTDIALDTGTNYKILYVSTNQAPTLPAAMTGTTNGAVVATSALSGGAFAAHELTEIAGQNAISPKNLAIVVDSTTGQPIQSSGRDVYALLTVESTGTDGAAFDDTSEGNRCKLSFVRLNAARDDLEACPIGDLVMKTINYAYAARINLDAIPEDAYLNSTILDQTASIDVTLTNAVANQGSGVDQTTKNIQWLIGDDYSLKFQTSDAGVDLLAIKPAAAGDVVDINAALTVTNTSTISIGSTVGQIDSSAALTVASGASNDLTLMGTREMFLHDGNQAGSDWVGTVGVKLSDTAQEWTDYKAAFGEVSLLKAVKTAASSSVWHKDVAVVTTDLAADVNVTGAGGSPNIDAQLGDYSAVSLVTNVDIYVNGQLQRGGANSSANNDVYPGTSAANGDLKFEFPLKTGDVITMIRHGV